MKLIYIPSGPKNLTAIFPAVVLGNAADYYLTIKSESDVVLATTNTYTTKPACDNAIRIHWLNALGTIDAVTLELDKIDTDTNSERWKKPLAYPLAKPVEELRRFNIRSSDTHTATTVEYTEADMDWLMELAEAPMAWLEWKGTQSQPDSYLPIIVLDGKFEKLKQDDRYVYEFRLQFKMSNEKISLR